MTLRLYQGVKGEFDRSQLCADETQSVSWASSRNDEDPKLREECGVVAIHGYPDAARQVYLGLYALQHRGQESAGIASADGQRLAKMQGRGGLGIRAIRPRATPPC